MTKFVFHYDPKKLPKYSESCHPVLIYNKFKWDSLNSSCIARPLIEKIRDLGVRVSIESFDFLTIAMAVTAADTFCCREDSDNSWARELELELPLYSPAKWVAVSKSLEQALGFLTGDIWKFKFTFGGLPPPLPKRSKKVFRARKSLNGGDCVCLFSGGLDSAIGAIDLVNGSTNPLLVSHAYKGDASKQNEIERVLVNGKYSRLSYNADPHIVKCLEGKIDITMRGRSFNFIAMAVLGLSVLQRVTGHHINKVIVPENGYISLNPPLTRRRIGSLSTRTTHPYFISRIQDILNSAGINIIIENPYQIKTKGEMMKDCKDQIALEKALPSTVSCSNWHRKGVQCGRCVPCLIRKSAVFFSGFTNDAEYESMDLGDVLSGGDIKDDLVALTVANIRLTKGHDLSRWVRESGPLPSESNARKELVDVFSRGLKEVGAYLRNEKIL
jgi:7-cyano-7-deazaguanine synthase in queuosine biosynthesis